MLLPVKVTLRSIAPFGLVVGLACVITGCHAITGTAQSTGASDQAAAPTGTGPTPVPGNPNTSVPPPTPYPVACGASALRVTVFPAAPYDAPTALAPLSFASEAIELVNESSTGCYLGSLSTITLSTSADTEQSVPIPQADLSDQQLPPGAAVLLDVGSPASCSSSGEPPDRVELGG